MNERIRKAADMQAGQLRAQGVPVQVLVVRSTVAELVRMGFRMDELLRDLDPPTPTTDTPRAAIAAPAPAPRQPEAAVPHLRAIAGGGCQPADDWADDPSRGWRAGA